MKLVKRTDNGINFNHSDIYKIAERLLELEEAVESGKLVEVVRCKDCRLKSLLYCPMADIDYCSEGRR